MRASIPAAVLLSLVSATAALAQVFPPDQAPPAASGAAPVPPPTVLLPPGASDTGPAPAPPSEEAPAKPKEPPPRPRHMAAIIQALDKTTAETMRFEAPVGQPVRYKELIFTVHVCEDAPPELGEHGAAAHLEIQSSPRPVPGRETPPTRQLFRGWMFANAPGLHPFEHPVYDAWLIGCRGTVSAPPAPPAPSPAPAPAPAPAPPAR